MEQERLDLKLVESLEIQSLNSAFLLEKKNNGQNGHYFYDLPNRALIVGQDELETYLEDCDSDANSVYDLRHLLRDGSIELPPFVYRRKPERKKGELLRYGRWLIDIVGQPENKYERVLNRDIIFRASRLELGPSPWEITHHPAFKSLAKFYTELGLVETRRAGMFDNWSTADFGSYIQELSSELGRKPTREDIVLAAKQTTRRPSLNVVISKMGSLSGAYEAAGYPNVRAWTKADYITWGRQFMEANGGTLPTQAMIEYMSRKKLCPSASTFAKNFSGSLYGYHSDLEKEFARTAREQAEHKNQILSEISSGMLPEELFAGTENEEERLRVYSKYVVADELLGEGFGVSKVTIARGANEASGRNFMGGIRKINNAITAGDIESAALYKHVYDFIWPPDKSYLSTLSLQTTEFEVFMEKLRQADKIRAVKRRIKDSEKRLAA